MLLARKDRSSIMAEALHSRPMALVWLAKEGGGKSQPGTLRLQFSCCSVSKAAPEAYNAYLSSTESRPALRNCGRNRSTSSGEISCTGQADPNLPRLIPPFSSSQETPVALVLDSTSLTKEASSGT